MVRFNLLTTFYNDMNDDKLDETIFCINENLKNSKIRNIFIFLEVKNINKKYLNSFYKNNYDLKLNEKLVNFTKNNKIRLFLINERPTFEKIFTFCNKIESRWIICNSDIYYPNWDIENFKLLTKIDYNKYMHYARGYK